MQTFGVVWVVLVWVVLVWAVLVWAVLVWVVLVWDSAGVSSAGVGQCWCGQWWCGWHWYGVLHLQIFHWDKGRAWEQGYHSSKCSRNTGGGGELERGTEGDVNEGEGGLWF